MIITIFKIFLAICHGPQILSAVKGALNGRKVTAYPGESLRFNSNSHSIILIEILALKSDMENAGAVWEGSCDVTGAVVDGNLVTGQAWPGHPQWIGKFLELLGTKITL